MFKACLILQDVIHEQIAEILAACGIVHDATADLRLIIEPMRAGVKIDNSIVYCDFNDAWHQNITYTIKIENSALARAINIYPGIRILDATAGLGRDAFTLSVLKANVCALERHPILAFMLMYAARSMHNLNVVNINHNDEIGRQKWDCIYFDFMFEKKNRNAKANQGMELIASLAETELLPFKIWQAAIRSSKRIVVKRPKKQMSLPIEAFNVKPNHTISTKNICFDVYLGELQ